MRSTVPGTNGSSAGSRSSTSFPRRPRTPKLRQRLRREARAVASLNHPAIVQIYDIIERDEGDWIVMELVEGETLRRMVKRGEIDWRDALRYARTVAEGLAEAHAKGIVHRDLKSENVMVNGAGHAKILDFGLAKRLAQGPQDTALSVQGAILGTGRAMSPEQAKGDDIDHRSDLFSLGTLLYETTTGRAPFRGQSIVHTLAQVCSERQRPVHEVRRELPPELSEIVDRLLEKDPDRRPQNAMEVAIALGNILGIAPTEGRLYGAQPDVDRSESEPAGILFFRVAGEENSVGQWLRQRAQLDGASSTRSLRAPACREPSPPVLRHEPAFSPRRPARRAPAPRRRATSQAL